MTPGKQDPAPAGEHGEGSADGPLRISVLGSLAAEHQGVPLKFGGPQQRAVLARLVIARGDAVPVPELADSLWDVQPPPHATAVLQAHVSRLRRLLEPDRAARTRVGVITSVGGGYALQVSADAIDAWRFERLVQEAAAAGPAVAVKRLDTALQLWRGPALGEFGNEPWAAAETSRLSQLRTLAQERLLAARLETCDPAVLIPEIEALVAAEPFSEERWRLLVLALYRANRQADALAALRRARATLAEELGIDPGPALRSLEMDVLRQSPALVVAPPGPAWQPPGSPPVGVDQPAGPAVAAVLVERDSELSQLAAHLASLHSGRARLVLIDGPPGIGRSRLLTEIRRLALGAAVLPLTARGSQQETDHGFGLARQLFEPLLADRQRRGFLLDSDARSAGRIFDGPTTPEGSVAVLHGLYRLTAELAADHPIALLIDDLQWADESSLRYLGYLMRRLDGLPILVAATVRAAEFPDHRLLDELVHDRATTTLRLAPLTLDGVAALVQTQFAAAADATFVRACHASTGGNPLLVRQLLRVLEAEQVPPDRSHADAVTAIASQATTDAVLERLRRVPPSHMAVVRAIAVLGGDAALPTVAALAGLPEPDAAASITALARAGIIRDGHPLRFVEPRVGDAIYRNLSATEQALQHERAARVLDTVAAKPEQLAVHLLKAPRRGDPWVVGVLHRAAADALERGAATSAAGYLTRADVEAPGRRPDPPPPAVSRQVPGHRRRRGRRTHPPAGLRDAH